MSNLKLLLPFSSNNMEIPTSTGGQNLLDDILNSKSTLLPRKLDKEFVLYGAGSLGIMAKEMFNSLGFHCRYVIDRNAERYQSDSNWEGIKVLSPQFVVEEVKKNCIIVICIVNFSLMAIYNELKKAGWIDIVFFYDVAEAYKNSYPINNGWFLHNIDSEDYKYIMQVYNNFSDDISRAFYIQYIAWKKLHTEIIFNDLKIIPENRFFIPEVTNVLRNNEVFIDGGAHKGFVIKKFLNTTNNHFKDIFAFEPDTINYKILADSFGSTNNIYLLNRALGSSNCTSSFSNGFDFLSKISNKGNTHIEVVKLDDLNIEATFIKFHLEGGELDALYGSINMIKIYRPILAITLYHNYDGLWAIPKVLSDSLSNYMYFYRLHSWAGTGAVLYAIPLERF